MLTQLISAAVVGALSPAAVLAAITLLSSRRPLLNTSMCLLGWTVVLMALAGLLYVVFHGHTGTSGKSAKTAVGLIVGLLLLGVAVRDLVGGQNPLAPSGADSPRPPQTVPAWMRRLEVINPGQSFLIGMVLIAVSPADLAVYFSAVQALTGSGFDFAEKLATFIALLVCIDLCIIIPLAMYVAIPRRAARMLSAGKVWLIAHQRAVTGWSAAVFGVILIVNSVTSIG
jgi:hypothetical protein